MPAKKQYAIVFIHGLAKKPSPDKLEEIWRWGIERADPNADAFPNPNPGINLTHYFAGKTFRTRLAEAIGVDLS